MSQARADAIHSVEQRIAKHFEVFQSLLDTAEGCAGRGDWAAAVAYAGMAASYGTWNNPGLYASPRLESLLARAAETVASAEPGRASKPRSGEMPKRILHVVTEGYSLGGHTRLIWRWIRADAQRSHSIAFTRQGARTVPDELLAAVAQRDGQVYFLDAQKGGVLAWARALRHLALGFDQIVLHIHPADVLPAVAFADKRGLPPIAFLNHADHIFWVGAGISDVVMNIRESGRAFSRDLRGVAEARSTVLPIPIEPVTRQLSRAEAKRQLGLSEDTPVLLSVASKYKFDSILSEPSLVDSMLPVLAKHPQAVWLVIGPERGAEWEKGSRESGDRIRALGAKKDVAVYYQAADIYVDSHPVCSFTSLLEAGSFGAPLVTFWPPFERDHLARVDCPGFADTICRTLDAEAFSATLTNLLQDETARLELGERTRAAIEATNMGAGWLEYLEHSYTACAGSVPAECRPERVQDASHVEDLNIRLVCIYDNAESSNGLLEEILRVEAGVLPLAERLKLWLRQFHGRPNVLPHFLLSDRIQNNVRKLMARRRAA